MRYAGQLVHAASLRLVSPVGLLPLARRLTRTLMVALRRFLP